VLLFELLFGRACYQDQRTREIVAKVIHTGLPLDELANEGVPEPLIEIVSRATDRRPEMRYRSGSAMVRELVRWLELAGHHTTPPTLAKFLEQQRLLEDGDPPAVRLSQMLDEDATEAMAPPGDTLSALIIREDLDLGS
jgi:hypothetical protein